MKNMHKIGAVIEAPSIIILFARKIDRFSIKEVLIQTRRTAGSTTPVSSNKQSCARPIIHIHMLPFLSFGTPFKCNIYGNAYFHSKPSTASSRSGPLEKHNIRLFVLQAIIEPHLMRLEVRHPLIVELPPTAS